MSSATIREQSIAGVEWLVVTGSRADAFRALGEHARASVAAVQDALPEREGLRRFVSTERGSEVARRIIAATEASQPGPLSDLRALAEGASYDFEALLLANLRGDLGIEDGTGCSDLAWRRRSAFVAHNEDGAPALDGQFKFVTLDLDDAAPLTAQWYPGFLPSNAWCANAHGLVWGINHVQVASPAPAPGRHFVARGLQNVRDLNEAVDYLNANPMGGGFTFTIGEHQTGRSAVVESAAGRTAVRSPQADSPLQWHTNHLRFLPSDIDSPAAGLVDTTTSRLGLYDESITRGEVLDRLDTPTEEPTPSWFTELMGEQSIPQGVHRTAAGADPLMTLCTSVVDLHRGRLHLVTPHGKAETDLVSSARGAA